MHLLRLLILKSSTILSSKSVLKTKTLVFFISFLTSQGLAKNLRPSSSEKTFLPGDIPTAERLKKLRPFFSPPIGESVDVDPRELRDFDHPNSKVHPLNLRGFIEVRPPKGYCFLITRDLDEPDDNICKAQKLSFTISQMQKSGKVTWTLKTGPEDYGTQIAWQLPYRLASLIPDTGKYEGVDYRLIQNCKALRHTPLGHQIILRFFGGEEWLIDLPEHEELLPQPPSPPNLYIATAQKKGVSKQGATTTQTSQSTSTSTSTNTSTDIKTETKGTKDEDTSVTESKDPVVDQLDDREIWAIPARNGYKMEGYRLMPYGTTTKWFKGECRYSYNGPKEDPDTGRLECHEVDGFKEVYLPLTCLKEFRK